MFKTTIKTLTYSALIVFLLGVSAKAETVRIPLNHEAQSVRVVEKGPGSIILEFKIPELILEKISEPYGDFTRIRIQGEHTTKEPGHPELPVIRRLIRVPADQNLTMEFSETRPQTILFNDYSLPDIPYPVQEPQIKRQDVKRVFTKPDQEVYKQQRIFPAATLTDLGVMRDERIYRLDVFPVLFDPGKASLSLKETVTVTLQESAGKNLYTPPPSPAFRKLTAPIMSISENPPSLIQSPPGYLIVTSALFMPVLEEFIAWKTKRGFFVDTLILENLANIDTSDIRIAIHDKYNNPDTGKPVPSFVLLIGDHEQLPAHRGRTNSHLTDLPYVSVTHGDYLPDMYIGRLSARNITELNNMLDKILMVEQYTYENPVHLDDVMLIAGWDAIYAFQNGFPAVNYAHSNYFNPENNFTTYKYLSTRTGANQTDVRNRLNLGHSFIYYTGHGSSISWADPSVSVSVLNTIQASGSAPLVISNACQTGSFSSTTSFAEAWLRLEGRGASAFIGATEDTYWDEDLHWAVGYYTIENDGRTPTREETGTGMFDIPFTRQDLDNPSALIYTGNLAVMESGSYLSPYYWEVYELFGDPAMTLRFGQSKNLSAQIPDYLTWGSTSLSVQTTDAPYALIGFSLGDSLIASGYTDEWGSAILTFPPVSSLDNHRMMVTAPGYIPVEKTISVIHPSFIQTDRDTIPIQEFATVQCFLSDNNAQPLPGILLWAAAPGFASDTVITDADGQAELPLTAPYGPYVILTSYDPSGYYPTFRDTLYVSGGSDFSDPAISITTNYGLSDTLAPSIPGILSGYGDVTTDIWFSSNNSVFTGGGDSIHVLMTKTGTLFAALTAPGYNTFYRSFPILNHYISLSGTVTDNSGEPIHNADILLEGDSYRSYQYTSDVNGQFYSKNPLLMEPLYARIRAFGYEDKDTLFIPQKPSHTFSLQLVESPYVTWAARIYDVEGKTLNARYRLFIGTGDSLYREGYCTNHPDSNIILNIPSFTYTLYLDYPGYIPVKMVFNTHDSPFADIPMVLKEGILIVDDNSSKRFYDKKAAIPVSNHTIQSSSLIMADILRDAGLQVTVKTSSATNPDTWLSYNGVIFARGANQTSISLSMQNALRNYLEFGGPLIIEGGEIAYRHYEDDFGPSVLRIENWITDKGGNITLTDEGQQLFDGLYSLPREMTHHYSVYGDQDVVLPLKEGVLSAGSWSEKETYSSFLIVPDTMIYMAFNFAALSEEEHRHHLLLNSIRLINFTNPHTRHTPHAWIDTYTLQKGSEFVFDPLAHVWDPDGDSLFLMNIFSGDIHGDYKEDSAGRLLIYSAPAYPNVSDTIYFTVSDGIFSDTGMIIFNITGNAVPTQVALVSPDNNYINRDSTSIILRWTEAADDDRDTLTYIIALLQSDGVFITDTLLMSMETNIRIYPRELRFESDLPISWQVSATDGQDTSRSSGIRTFTMDNSVYNSLNPEGLLPAVFSAGPNYPNPFNPVTTIPLALPEADEVKIVMFDIRGTAVAEIGPLSLQAGYHNLIWEGRNRFGQSLSTGMYIGRITTLNGHTATLKLLYMK